MSAVPQSNAVHFVELACWESGGQPLGLAVALENGLEGFGSYQRVLEEALTLYEYLRKAVALYNVLMSGQRLWLSWHGEELRLSVESAGEIGLAFFNSHLEVLVITILNIRRRVEHQWVPREIGLVAGPREALPDLEFLAGTRIRRENRASYVAIPRRLMGAPMLKVRAQSESTDMALPDLAPLSGRIGDAVGLQIQSLLPARKYGIGAIAETLDLSPRTLQRRLEQEGLTFSQLLSDVRLRMAADRLSSTDMGIWAIALDLGYTDASNFTRAFRAKTGVSPQTFRENINKSRDEARAQSSWGL
jgi:AraC-like DNA-binding protein